MSGWSLDDQKETLISIIRWYRDEYHRHDINHTDMIAAVMAATQVDELERYWQATDAWLDNND